MQATVGSDFSADTPIDERAERKLSRGMVQDVIEYAVAGGDTQGMIGTSGANISSIEARATPFRTSTSYASRYSSSDARLALELERVYFIDSSVGIAEDLSGAPISELGRRTALPAGEWLLLEKRGAPFVLAGIEPREVATRAFLR